MQFISSPQNGHIKELKAYQDKAKKRKQESVFCIEGEKEIRHALKGGFRLKTVFVKQGYTDNVNDEAFTDCECIEVANALFETLCYRKNTSVLIGVAHMQSHQLDRLQLPQKNAFILIAEAPEKPGNIGALLRTADAIGVDAMLLVNPKTDLYNPNVVRSSVGCLFSVPVGVGGIEETISFLGDQKINIFSAALTANAKNYSVQDFTGSIAIAVGTEDNGLTDEWLAQNTTQIYIPMAGENDSLNVSVAAGILLAEARRQRN